MTAPSTRERPTLWRQLWNRTFGAVLAVWITLSVVAVSTGFHEARKFLDGQLSSVGQLWLAAAVDRPSSTAATLAPGPAPPDLQGEYFQSLALLAWEDGALVNDSHRLAAGLDLTALTNPGLHTVVFSDASGRHDWRAYVAQQPRDGRVYRVAVLVELRARNALGWDMAEHVTLPALLLLPLVALLLWWSIRRGLRPLERLSREVAELDSAAGQRLDGAHRHREFASTVSAINALVDSLEAQAERERAFASDVAHELRTPLAAIALQAGVAQHEPSPERLAQLEQEALRAGRILTQLLDLARAQRHGGAGDAGHCPVALDLGEVAERLVAELAPQAHGSEHELSLQSLAGPVQVFAAPLLLELALRNLIGNALRHTPGGTQVVVEVWRSAEAHGVSVSDDGQRAGAPAPRASSDGLGLGLRLVERMAEQMGAQLQRSPGAAPMTTCFTLHWPG
jgi:two-component system, OmpR family, sensor histidine kinase QseC